MKTSNIIYYRHEYGCQPTTALVVATEDGNKKSDTDNPLGNGPFAINSNIKSSRLMIRGTNASKGSRKYAGNNEKKVLHHPSNKEEKVFYIRKFFSHGRKKDYSMVQQYTITSGTIIKAIEEQSKENIEESDKYLDIFSRNYHGHFRNITLSFYDEEVNRVIKIWGDWYNMFPLLRGTPLMYKCYICYKGWWRLHPFKEHLKGHSDSRVKLGSEPIHNEFNVVASTKKAPKVKNVKMDSNCWKCGRNATFHYSNPSPNYKCSVCKKNMATCTILTKHESICIKNYNSSCEKISVDAEGSRCTVCKIYCVNEHALDAHMIDYHLVRSDEPVVLDTKVCKLCRGRYFIYKFHDCPDGEKPSKCNVCGRSFASPIFRRIHMEYSMAYIIKCTVCGKFITQCMVAEHYTKHSDNYCLLYMCSICNTEVLFINKTVFLNHIKIHTQQTQTCGRMLLPAKCFNGEIVKCETRFRILNGKLDNFLAGLEDNKGISIDTGISPQTEEIPCSTHELSTPNTTAADVDGDVIILDDDDNVNPSIEPALKSENLDDNDFDIKAMQAQLDEEIMRDLEVEATICKSFQSSKSFQLWMQNESSEKKPEENGLLKKEYRTEGLIEKESIKNELLENVSIKKELLEIKENDIIILDDEVEDVNKKNSDIKSETALEPHDIMDCNSSDSNFDTPTFVKKEYSTNDKTIKAEPEVFIREKFKLAPSKDYLEEVHKHMLVQIKRKKRRNSTTVPGNHVYKCMVCGYKGYWNVYIPHVSTKCPGTEFSCNLCKKAVRFHSLYYYLQHLTVHDYKPLTCPQCQVVQKSPFKLYRHVTSHILAMFSGNPKFSTSSKNILSNCNKCGNCVSLEHFFKHWQTHFNGQRSNSTDEDSALENRDDSKQKRMVSWKSMSPELIKEVLDILQNKIIQDCNVCSKKSKTLEECKQHLIEHLLLEARNGRTNKTGRVLKCYFCGMEISKEKLWRLHMREHSHMPSYKCEMCSVYFCTLTTLRRHKQNSHSFDI